MAAAAGAAAAFDPRMAELAELQQALHRERAAVAAMQQQLADLMRESSEAKADASTWRRKAEEEQQLASQANTVLQQRIAEVGACPAGGACVAPMPPTTRLGCATGVHGTRQSAHVPVSMSHVLSPACFRPASAGGRPAAAAAVCAAGEQQGRVGAPRAAQPAAQVGAEAAQAKIHRLWVAGCGQGHIVQASRFGLRGVPNRRP